MSTVSAFKKWESKSALLAHLDSKGERGLLIGGTAEAPHEFYSFSILSSSGGIEIGLLSSGFGNDPATVVVDGGRLALIGHDQSLTWVDLEKGAVASSMRLNGVFYKFISLKGDDEIVAMHEIGIVRVTASGALKWSVDTDIISDVRHGENGSLVLTMMDASPQVVVSLENGKVNR